MVYGPFSGFFKFKTLARRDLIVTDWSGLPKNEMLLRLKDNHSLCNPVYIGDTSGDETAAQMAGMAFIHVAWGFGKPQGRLKIVNSFRELVGFLNFE